MYIIDESIKYLLTYLYSGSPNEVNMKPKYHISMFVRIMNECKDNKERMKLLEEYRKGYFEVSNG